jgi:hypothetical protein
MESQADPRSSAAGNHEEMAASLYVAISEDERFKKITGQPNRTNHIKKFCGVLAEKG